MHVIDFRALALRLVDNKAVLYFDAPGPSEALNWYRGKQVSSPFPLGEALTRAVQQLIYTYQHRKHNLTGSSCARAPGFSSPIHAADCMRSLFVPTAVSVYIHILFNIFVPSFKSLTHFFCRISPLRFFLRRFFFSPLATQGSFVNYTRLFTPVCCVNCT